ncbi:MAG TPA: TlpA family protein disulfide reductase, partial [Beijerinckia sp.]|nr:TlpA family protein disulfide reductase [Beijerinckia sp.]
MIEDSSKSAPRRSFLRGFALLAAILAVAAGLAILLYGMKAPSGKETAEASSCPAARERVAQLKPLVHGEVAALSLASSPAPLPDLSFDGADGTR